MLRILFEVKWTLRHKEYNLKPQQIKKSISIDYKWEQFSQIYLIMVDKNKDSSTLRSNPSRRTK